MSENRGIEVPAPTAWPMVTSLGVMLLFAGLVMTPVVSLVGAVLALVGTVAWAREVYPHPREELALLLPLEQRARPVQPALEEVEQMHPGEDGHRVSLPIEMHPYSSGARGGLAGAVAMAAVAVVYGVTVQGSLWYPINLLASTISMSMASADTETLRAFHAGPFLTASFIHVVLSVLAGLVYAAVLPMLPGRSMLWGGIVAPVLWSGVAYLSLGIVSPTMDTHVSWPWFLASQVAFGLACGVVVERSEVVKTMQLFPLAVRASVESPGLRRDDEKRP
jgi:hypothetical protein